jgi:RHS repeat-associated protein
VARLGPSGIGPAAFGAPGAEHAEAFGSFAAADEPARLVVADAPGGLAVADNPALVALAIPTPTGLALAGFAPRGLALRSATVADAAAEHATAFRPPASPPAADPAPPLFFPAGALRISGDGLDPQALAASEYSQGAGEMEGFRVAPPIVVGQVSPDYDLYYYHLDHLGTPRLLTDANGDIDTVHKYFPFGDEIQPLASDNTHQFTGHERDPETGLDYLLARYYGAVLGRFASFDGTRLGVDRRLPQTWNGYLYAPNSPLNNLDPNGLYETNFHQGWTYMLAKQAGFTETEARTIAQADTDMDKGKTRPTKMIGGADERRDFHGFGADRDLARDAALASGSLVELGQRLHHFQDTFSHEGFGADQGHFWAGHRPDKTSKDPAKAVEAALQTFDILNAKAAEMGAQGFGAPDQDLLEAMAKANADVKDYDPASNTLTLETSKKKASQLAEDLAAQGYKVSIDGVPYNY